jgi:serine O-acetyltransferase
MSERVPSARESFRLDRAAYPREAWISERALWAVAAYRLGSWLDSRFGAWLAGRPLWLRYAVKVPLLMGQRLVEALTGVELPPQTSVGPGLRIWHGGNIVINPRTRIGSHCVMRHGVTIGNVVPNGRAPVIGDRVELGAYAQVLGGVTVGDDARVGAMSVVLQDVPPGATAVGVPARIIPPRYSDPESEVDAS